MRALLTVLLAASLCAAAGIRGRLASMGFTDIVTLSAVPKEICGPLVVRATAVADGWKDNFQGERIGRVDSGRVAYIGDSWPVTGTALADFEGLTYAAIETETFLILLANVSEDERRGRFMMVMIFKSGRTAKYIIQ